MNVSRAINSIFLISCFCKHLCACSQENQHLCATVRIVKKKGYRSAQKQDSTAGISFVNKLELLNLQKIDNIIEIYDFIQNIT